MAIEIGRVEALFRYPVTSMRGERLGEATLGWHGRRFASAVVHDGFMPDSAASTNCDMHSGGTALWIGTSNTCSSS